MHTVQLGENRQIDIDPDFIDEETLRAMMAFRAPPMTLDEAAVRSAVLRDAGPGMPMAMAVPPGELLGAQDDTDAALEKALAMLAQDPDFAPHMAEARSAMAEADHQPLKVRLASETPGDVLQAYTHSLQVERVETPERVDFVVNGAPAIGYRKGLLGRSDAEKAELVVAWVLLFWDALGFLATVISLAFPKFAGKVKSAFTKYCSKILDKISAFAARMKLVESAADASAKIKALIGAFKVYSTGHVVGALKKIWGGMSLGRRILAVGEFIATFALYFVTAGAGAVAKAVRMVAYLVNVIADVVRIRELQRA